MSLDGIINGYTVLNLNHSSDRFTIYNAKDRNGSPCLLKVCHDGGSKQTAYKQATSDAMLESFIYNNNGEEIQCYIFPTSTLDYFTCNQSSNPTKSHQSRLKTLNVCVTDNTDQLYEHQYQSPALHTTMVSQIIYNRRNCRVKRGSLNFKCYRARCLREGLPQVLDIKGIKCI
ncbi:hypothetical protein AO441_004114 [Nakaseomyces glabratus]|uniref:Uncharacterized protein n=1 Tax=Candida glabrata TaxID=5478 RepID=A0A0W0EMW3_CANGB|nr:hypothetical protein AO440_005214 [Nakaseomyces glabratus]KTA98685.1 hypothetical protein AO439_005072 [Nakaseomyces glabratus]KTB06764.1 hypothetical protein AO441_004114 [Nakaseomyces glabratus]KTB08368.1 hypothetical protein AO439_004245 [Nakaseomyces glabratus]KTB12784.1 hypothetical protein AO440_005791 [Nakaseomyces glabratus]